jgi:type II secretory ATPase GspE/PulE/Tfp pilus assembly ATPase PilB-like protein
MAKKQPNPEELAPPIDLIPQGAASKLDDQKNGIAARNQFGPGYLTAQRMLADAIDRRADLIVIELAQQGAAIRYRIDGLWMNAAMLDPMTGMALLGSMKTLAAMAAQDHRGEQRGKFAAEYRKKKTAFKLTCQGIPPQAPAGVRVSLVVDDPKGVKLNLPPDLGMREKLHEQVKLLFAQTKGLILVATPPTGGFSTLFNAVVTDADRYVRTFTEVRPKDHPDKPIDNVAPTNFEPPQTALDVLPKLVRTYPDAIVLRDLPSKELVEYLLGVAEDDSHNVLIVAGVRATECCEAIQKLLAMKVDPRRLAAALQGVITGRLVRMLCENCKRPFPPPPQLLMQLGIPPGKVAAFFAPHEGPLPPASEKEEPRMCPNCGGMGFKGRIGLFELLVANDAFRQAVAASQPLDALRNAARAAGMRTMQEEGVVLVAKGVTALPELMRVLQSREG